jgi:UDP-glucose 4-epimerase
VNVPNWITDFTILKSNWDSPEQLEKLCQGIDVIVHAAGMNAQDCLQDPSAALAVNGVATSRLIEAARSARVKKFIYFSTAHVYKSPLQGVITEETTTENLHPYATSHLAGEACLRYAIQQGHIQGTVIRLSNAFGSPASVNANCWDLLVNDLCKQAVQNGFIVLKTPGLQQRNFIAIADFCDTIQKIIDYEPSLNLNFALPDVLNVGSNYSMSVLEIATLISQRAQIILGKTVEIKRPIVESMINIVNSEPFLYSIDRLKRMGIQIDDSSIAEIDNLILFCKREFNSK